MATIIILVVVALVFFAALSVAIVMIWKQKRSLEDIEDRLDEFADSFYHQSRCQAYDAAEYIKENLKEELQNDVSRIVKEQEKKQPYRYKEENPFEWAEFDGDEIVEEETQVKYAGEPVEEFPPEPEEYDFAEAGEIVLPDLAEMESSNKKIKEIEDFEALLEDLVIEDPVEEAEDSVIEEMEEEPDYYEKYSVGRSGKKYTATELEMLIKE